jgi:hypothetical protein
MLEGSLDGVHLKLGMAAFRVRRVQTLRFCRACDAEMSALYGERYWLREHQLPSVLVCPRHACSLQRSLVSLPARGRHEFVAATATVCPADAPRLVTNSRPTIVARLAELADRSVKLLREPIESQGFAAWTAFYREEMVRAGLAISIRRMSQLRLEAEVREYYGQSLSLFPEVYSQGEFAGGWLAAMVRKHRKVAHPIQHLLLQCFLESKGSIAPMFGDGPWPCLNPLARHRESNPITTIRSHNNRRHRIGVFACHCGYVYTRRFNVDSAVLEPPRFQQYGPMLGPALVSMLKSGSSLRAVARKLKIDPKTVASLARDLGISAPWSIPKFENRRKRPTSPRTKVATSPRPGTEGTRAAARSARKDWNAIDATCAQEIEAIAASIRQQVPPRRVTGAEIERRMGHRDWIQKRLAKLPKARAGLESVLESIGDFQTRRIRWAIQEKRRSSDDVRAWEVMRTAGVRSNLLPRIRAILEGRAR